MKKVILMISMSGLLFLSSFAQTQPAAKKDSVNADKAAKPVFYNAAAEEETSKSSGPNYALIGGAVVVLGAAGYFLMKKKK
jgi:LPXTG-motif cell wall-anchored protein